MKNKYTINFQEVESPITEPITKFGGQPVWIEKPEWAVSLSTGKPLTFICQIALDEEIFGQTESRMAYIFMNDDDEVDETWETDGGENAVIIQPSGNNPKSVSIQNGESLSIWKEIKGEMQRKPFPCEFAVEKSEVVPDAEPDEDEDDFENKVGGIPRFLQGEEYPDNENNEKDSWKLLLQLDSVSVPFEINFGDAGIGYAFISNDGKTGKFLWQCG